MKKETRYKLRLIKKYAVIRFRRWWKEWGLSKQDVEIGIGAAGVVLFPLVLSILACMF